MVKKLQKSWKTLPIKVDDLVFSDSFNQSGASYKTAATKTTHFGKFDEYNSIELRL